WPRNDDRRALLIDSRPETADDVAEWARAIREMDNGRNGQDGRDGRSAKSTKSTESTRRPASFPEIAANGALALISVACSLLDRQIAAQERAFVEEGGFTERLYRVRTAARKDRR